MISCFSLYDESGNMLRPWAEAGAECYCVDIQAKPRHEVVGKGFISFCKLDCMSVEMDRMVNSIRPYFVFGFPPCTDVAVSGAKHFDKKMSRNQYCMAEAAELAVRVPGLAASVNAIWAFENPKSMLTHYLGEPQHKFHPWEYGGYLPEDDIHPRWPDYIPPRDAYPKETWLWASARFVMPPKAEVYCPPGWSPQTLKLGGKSEKTKQIRSETPRGFAKAVFMANRPGELV